MSSTEDDAAWARGELIRAGERMNALEVALQRMVDLSFFRDQADIPVKATVNEQKARERAVYLLGISPPVDL